MVLALPKASIARTSLGMPSKRGRLIPGRAAACASRETGLGTRRVGDDDNSRPAQDSCSLTGLAALSTAEHRRGLPGAPRAGTQPPSTAEHRRASMACRAILASESQPVPTDRVPSIHPPPISIRTITRHVGVKLARNIVPLCVYYCACRCGGWYRVW